MTMLPRSDEEQAADDVMCEIDALHYWAGEGSTWSAAMLDHLYAMHKMRDDRLFYDLLYAEGCKKLYQTPDRAADFDKTIIAMRTY